MVKHITDSIPDGRRQALLKWAMAPEFDVVLDIITARISEAIATHAERVLRDPTRHIRMGGLSHSEQEGLGTVSEWNIVRSRLQELRTLITNEEMVIQVGRQILVD